MRPHYSQSSRENATPSSGTSPLASYKEVTPPPPRVALKETLGRVLPQTFKTLGVGGRGWGVRIKESCDSALILTYP